MLVNKHSKFNPTYRLNCSKLSIILFVFFLACVISSMNAFCSYANAAEVTLAWNISDSDLAGYNLYYSQCQLDENCTIAGKNKSGLKIWQIKIDDLQNPDMPQFTLHNLSDIHKYAFTLTAYNAAGDESDFSNEVNFTPPNSSPPEIPDPSDESDNAADNQPPEVDAGKDQTVDIKQGLIKLSGNVSDDGLPEGSKLTHKWYQSKGPGTAEFEDSFKLSTSVSFDKAGSYTLVLEAGDGQLTTSDSVTINVGEDSSDGAPGEDSNTTPSKIEEQAIIIDNDDENNTSSNGTWQLSNAPNCYGKNSIYANSGATFSYHFLSPATGVYDLSIWYTNHQTRSNIVPISIESENGIKQVSVNQRINGGQWVSLGIYKFLAGESYEIKISARKRFRSTNVDAIKVEYLGTDEEKIPSGYKPVNNDNVSPGCGKIEAISSGYDRN